MSDRRYRQRGYRDNDGDRSERKRPRGPRPPQHKEGPRGRGLGAPTEEVFRCPNCNGMSLAPGSTDFTAQCPRCEAGLHACVTCKHFDPSATYQCRQPIPAQIPRKRDNNECELYSAKTTVEFARENETLDPKDARAAFDKLFDF